MIIERFPAVQDLSPGEKWQLAEDLWCELLPQENAAQEDAILRLIEARMRDYAASAESSVTWDGVRLKMRRLRDG